MGMRVQWVKDIDLSVDEVGGKAAGLRKLIEWGLAIPAGFVIVDAQKDVDVDALTEYYQSMGGGKVAVRSSALGEDGSDHSFAGLYETVLNVVGEVELIDAVRKCVDSLNSYRASEYRQQQGMSESAMCVVVQRMVDAQAAGVLFSVDPVSGRHDRLVIDAVPGLGEALVSGDETPDHYEYGLDNTLCYEELVGDTAILTEAQRCLLVQQARAAVAAAGDPLDMEWAFDKNGELYWLQARPVTTVGSDLNELNTPINQDDVLTRCNIGEMMRD
jgi:pyruvate,water dikinase